MKDHFSPRSLIFYACAIGSVVILFSAVSAYGEKNLQAPQRIDGQYPLRLKASVPCFASKPIKLLLQQSGIFLTGSILPTDASDSTIRMAQERPALSGHWRNDRLTLEGSPGRSWNCPEPLQITGSVTQGTLNGTLKFSSAPGPIGFTGDRQAPKPNTSSH